MSARDSIALVEQKPIEGISFGAAKAKSRRTTQYFELGAHRGLYHDGWMASSMSFVPWQPVRGAFDPGKAKWELYNIDQDFSQADDLAAENHLHAAIQVHRQHRASRHRAQVMESGAMPPAKGAP